MFKLKKNEEEVYYLHNYIPIDKRSSANLNDKKLSVKVLNYKYDKKPEMRIFTRELMKAISFISENIIQDNQVKLALVSIPPSQVDKWSAIQESINKIENFYLNGIMSEKFNCSNEIVNCNVLKRISNVNYAHLEGPRPTYEEHIESISCNKDLSSCEATFILIDDITTRGVIMDACEDILRQNGAEDIYKLAISKTVSDYD